MNGALVVVDIRYPLNLTSSSRADVKGFGLAVQGGYAYLSSTRNGLKVIDIQDPSAPQLVGESDIPIYAYDISVQGDHVFAAAGEFGFKVFDVSDPTQPHVVSALALPASKVLELVGSYAYLPSSQAGVHVVDIAKPLEPVAVHTMAVPGFAKNLAPYGNSAFLATENDGVHHVDVSVPSKPVLGSTVISRRGPINDLVAAGELLFVLTKFDLSIWNIADPLNPSFVSEIGILDEGSYLELIDDVLYISIWQSGILAIKVSDPARPELLGLFQTDRFPAHMAASTAGLCVAGEFQILPYHCDTAIDHQD